MIEVLNMIEDLNHGMAAINRGHKNIYLHPALRMYALITDIVQYCPVNICFSTS